jgi:hypothetical protein|tara:strand:+ start:419 stop:607 length:189 start_codon:yes stop_codon:yes gene_type:complete
MYYKIELGLISLMIMAGNETLASLVGLVTLIYYGSMLKVNVVNKIYNGSWRKYFKSFFCKKK